MGEQSRPTVIVIFGASGDLTQRKLVPALHSLACEGLLPARYEVLGVARSPLSDDRFRERLYEGITRYARLNAGQCSLWPRHCARYTYVAGEYDDSDLYRRIAQHLDRATLEMEGAANRLYYLATPPFLYPVIIRRLKEAGLHGSAGGAVRIVVEKPFGHDLESARRLNDELHSAFEERQIFRIDHYLGKETVQNILTLRFANAIFEPLWNHNYVDHVQITVAEAVGIEHRAGYYEGAGVLRDVFQNHLMQLLTLTAMEPPVAFEAEALRDEKIKVLRAIRPEVDSVRGQYLGYREEPGVAPDSQTATYAALRLFVDNWRWSGVPFYLRSGKALAARVTEIAIEFRRVPHLLFPIPADTSIPPNVLSLCVQPDEGIHIRFETKVPGAGMRTRSVHMQFDYARDFGGHALPDAYERLLLDAMQGDASLFARADEIELAWDLIDRIQQQWDRDSQDTLAFYARGSWGPTSADDFIGREGRAWRRGCPITG